MCDLIFCIKYVLVAHSNQKNMSVLIINPHYLPLPHNFETSPTIIAYCF